MIPQSAILAMREEQRRAMDNRCTIYSPPSQAKANKGNAPTAIYPDDWTVVVSNTPCRVTWEERGASETETGGKISSRRKGSIVVSFGLAGDAKCRIRIATLSNLDVEVTAVTRETYATATHFEVVSIE